MTRKVFRAGNSLVVSIPSDAIDHLGLGEGSEVVVEVDRDEGRQRDCNQIGFEIAFPSRVRRKVSPKSVRHRGRVAPRYVQVSGFRPASFPKLPLLTMTLPSGSTSPSRSAL